MVFWTVSRLAGTWLSEPVAVQVSFGESDVTRPLDSPANSELAEWAADWHLLVFSYATSSASLFFWRCDRNQQCKVGRVFAQGLAGPVSGARPALGILSTRSKLTA